MSCSPFELRDYFLGELAEANRRQVEAHVNVCGNCRDDLQQLRLTEAALLSLRDEEIPQRIGFVSDKVFEPSAARRWWEAFWGSTVRLGFATAAMLVVAALAFTFHRPPTPVKEVIRQVMVPDQSGLEAAVQKAVAESEERQAKKTAALLAAAEKRHEMEQKALMLAVEENLSVMRKRFGVMLTAGNYAGDLK